VVLNLFSWRAHFQKFGLLVGIFDLDFVNLSEMLMTFFTDSHFSNGVALIFPCHLGGDLLCGYWRAKILYTFYTYKTATDIFCPSAGTFLTACSRLRKPDFDYSI
jgi:hypothetical protein